MKKIFLLVSKLVLGVFVVFLISSCGGGGRNNKSSVQDSLEGKITRNVVSSVTYNFYVENSGSVRAYFRGVDNDASVIIKEFYDRLDENIYANDSITLNYISNSITPYNGDVNGWLNQIYSKCNASYSDIDKVLTQVLDKTNSRTINFVLSDFCFVSKYGSLERAKSEITKIFTKALHSNKDLSVAIYKYNASFDGQYYPGAIKYKGYRPLYLWVFGPSWKVREVVGLKVGKSIEGNLFLQPMELCKSEIVTNNARMAKKNSNILHVDNWNEDRHEKGIYKVNVLARLDNVILPASKIKDVYCYSFNREGYYIEDIVEKGNGVYLYTICTTKPSPCELEISYSITIPEWVLNSDTETKMPPQDGKTYGIKSLIEGVSNAYSNRTPKLFKFELLLK